MVRKTLKVISMAFDVTIVIIFIILLSHIERPKTVTKVAPPEIKQAMIKMGPYKDYRMLDDETLQVKVNNKWLRLRH